MTNYAIFRLILKYFSKFKEKMTIKCSKVYRNYFRECFSRQINYAINIEYLKCDRVHTDSVNCIIKLAKNIYVSGSANYRIRIWFKDTRNIKYIDSNYYGSTLCLLYFDQHTFVSGGRENDISIWNYSQIWDINNSKFDLIGINVDNNKNLYGHKHFVTGLVKASKEFIASGSSDKTIRIWSLITFKQIKLFETHSIKGLIKISDNEVSSCSWDKTIRVWSLSNGKEIQVFRGHIDFVLCLLKLEFEQIASGSYDKTIRIWDINSNKELRKLEKHIGKVKCLTKISYSFFASGSDDNTIIIWCMHTTQIIKEFGFLQNSVCCLVFATKNMFLSGNKEGFIFFFGKKNIKTKLKIEIPITITITITRNNMLK